MCINLYQSLYRGPLPWGTYKADPDLHFFLVEFDLIANNIPEPESYMAPLIALPRGVSATPTGKFDFLVKTMFGDLLQGMD